MSTIVVIEDDAAMRTLICEWLAAEGYSVRGLGAPGNDPGAELVIVNVLNLRSQGAQTLREVQAVYPRSAMIGMSTQLARSLPGDSALAHSLGVRRLIAKPFTRDEMLAAVVATIGVAA
jgi:DNA-binding response OmpR family regulator